MVMCLEGIWIGSERAFQIHDFNVFSCYHKNLVGQAENLN